MTEIVAKTAFNLNNKYYFPGDKVKANFEQIIKLNEKGYIEPLTAKQLMELKEKKEE